MATPQYNKPLPFGGMSIDPATGTTGAARIRMGDFEIDPSAGTQLKGQYETNANNQLLTLMSQGIMPTYVMGNEALNQPARYMIEGGQRFETQADRELKERQRQFDTMQERFQHILGVIGGAGGDGGLGGILGGAGGGGMPSVPGGGQFGGNVQAGAVGPPALDDSPVFSDPFVQTQMARSRSQALEAAEQEARSAREGAGARGFAASSPMVQQLERLLGLAGSVSGETGAQDFQREAITANAQNRLAQQELGLQAYLGALQGRNSLIDALGRLLGSATV